METSRLILTDPEWIALESLNERTSRFIFGEEMLANLRERGLAEPAGEAWEVTVGGREALEARTH